jgi:hypothetical protein
MTQRRERPGSPTAASTPDEAEHSPRRRPGRPPIHAESWTKVTVVLFDRQIAYLDRIVATIGTRSGTKISRAQLIRALIDAAAEANLDLSESVTEAELRAAILSRMSSGGGQ